jgi:hypothetical protein
MRQRQIPTIFSTIQQRCVVHTSLVLSLVLHDCDIDYCENHHCTMNNVDSIGEAMDESSLIICPTCVRKLQCNCCHVNTDNDIKLLLQRLYKVLNGSNNISSVCHGDIRQLELYGIQE